MPTKKVLMKALELVDKTIGCKGCPIPKPCVWDKPGCSSHWMDEILEYAEKKIKEEGAVSSVGRALA